MSILLTDEENPYPYNPEPTPKLSNTAYNAFNVGAKAQLKKVVEWLDKRGFIVYEGGFPYDKDRQVFAITLGDKQALLKEIEEE